LAERTYQGAGVFGLQWDRLHAGDTAERAGAADIPAPVLEVRGQGENCRQVDSYLVRQALVTIRTNRIQSQETLPSGAIDVGIGPPAQQRPNHCQLMTLLKCSFAGIDRRSLVVNGGVDFKDVLSLVARNELLHP
jgi:hypothetical protein